LVGRWFLVWGSTIEVILTLGVPGPVFPQTTNPYLVRDIRTVPPTVYSDFSSDPTGFSSFLSHLYFRAGSGPRESYLFKTDGSPEHTTAVVAVDYFRNYQPRIVYNGHLFFPASDPATGIELWKSDGTTTGTSLVKDIRPGTRDSSPDEFFVFKDRLFFVVSDSQNPPEIWMSDGTAEGTRPLLNYDGPQTVPSIDGSPGLVPVGGYLLFRAWDSEHGLELWRTDGTASGTLLVRDINPGPSVSNPILYPTGSLDGRFFVNADDGVHGRELWITDGTEEGTVLFIDIWPGPDSSNPGFFTPLNDLLLFNASDGTHGMELWKTDGTEAGTALIRDIVEGLESPTSWRLYDHAELNGSLFFSLHEPEYGDELWKTDGTDQGTTIVRDIVPGREGSRANGFGPASLFRAGDRILFSSQFSLYYDQLWSTDGTSSGTQLLLKVEAHHGYANLPLPLGSDHTSPTLFGAYDDINGHALWKSDGTTSGTVLVETVTKAGYGSILSRLTESLGNLYFSANDGIHNYQLWTSSGTAPETRMITNLPASGIYGSWPRDLTPYSRLLYFLTSTSWFDTSLWRTDGTTSGTVLVHPVQEVPVPRFPYENTIRLTRNQDSLFYTTNRVQTIQEEETVVPELWKSDGSSSGSTIVIAGVNIDSITPAGNRLYFVGTDGDYSGTLWVSDGTREGTHVVQDRTGGTFTSPHLQLTVSAGNTLYFAIGGQLWKTDGTTTGTVLVRDLWDPIAEGGTISSDLIQVGDSVFFKAYTADQGGELWKSDGTASGTMQVAEINPSGNALQFFRSEVATGVEGILFFRANDGVHGFELWKSDGTEEGTILVKDIRPGLLSGNLDYFHSANGLLFFSADDGLTGPEPWVSDGTEAGTVRLADLAPGPIGSDPREFTFAGRHLYFTADDHSGIGRELWAVELLPAPQWNGAGWMLFGAPEWVSQP